MSDEVTASVIKHAETRIQTRLSRNFSPLAIQPGDKQHIGVTIGIKAVPAIEDFFRTQGNGETVDVNMYGRYWAPITGPLKAYAHAPFAEPLRSDDGTFILLDNLAGPLIGKSNQGVPTINLSYLRLVGISEGAGVSFGVRGVYSLELLRSLQQRLAMAQRRLYIEYIRPVDLNIFLSTSEVHY